MGCNYEQLKDAYPDEEQRDAVATRMFVAAWINVGGYVGDISSPLPWCMPSLLSDWIGWEQFMGGRSMEETALAYWLEYRDEIYKMLDEEAGYEED